MAGHNQCYCFDTSAFIILHREYPRELYPDLWPAFERIMDGGLVSSPREVLRELQAKASAPPIEWTKRWWEKIHDDDDNATARVVQENGRIQKMMSNSQSAANATTPKADPFVVALALRKGLTVVSNELATGGAQKIPKVCRDLNINCLTLQGMFQRQHWTFRLVE